MVEFLCDRKEKHDAAKMPARNVGVTTADKNKPAPHVGFMTGFDDPQRSYRNRIHELDEGGNLPPKNAQGR